MNKEIMKAMNKKETKLDSFKKWWRKNGYRVMRVVLFPVWACVVAKEKANDWLNSRQKWDEERVNEILSYYIPRRADWSDEDKTFYFFDNGMGWNLWSAKKYLKLKDRRFWKNHNHLWGDGIRGYLIDSFELEGFKKEVGNCEEGWTEISFTLIEK
jgi:hypothetical protein